MNYLYIADEALESIPDQGGTIYLGEQDTKHKYLTRKPLPEPATLVGQWENNGDVDVVAVDDYETYFQAFGNLSGEATDTLNTPGFQGHKQRHMQKKSDVVAGTLPQFPADKQPFALEMRHQEITEGTWQGHGWVCEMKSNDPKRDITARAIGIYSDPECTQYLYTTGAFLLEQDAEGNTRIYTECPLGQLKQTKEDIYFALLLGTAKEGFATLSKDKDLTIKAFWEKDAGVSISPVPIGETQEWAEGVAYKVGDEVMFKDVKYSCTIAHTSIASWIPPAAVSLWKVVK